MAVVKPAVVATTDPDETTETGEETSETTETVETPVRKPRVYDESYVSKQKRELAEARIALKALNDEKAAREEDDAKKKGDISAIAEKEKAKRLESEAKLAANEERTRKKILIAQLRSEAALAGMLDIDDVALIPTDDVEFDSEGDPQNVAELIEAYKAKKPAKFKAAADVTEVAAGDPKKVGTPFGKKPGKVLPSTGTGEASEPSGAKKAKDMTAEEYAKWKSEVFNKKS